MKNTFLLIGFILFAFSANAQNYWYSTGCYSDSYQFNPNHPVYYMYSRVDIGVFDTGFGPGGRVTPDNIDFHLNIIYVRPFYLNDSYYGDGCPTDSQYPSSNSFVGTATLNAKLYKNNVLVSTIVPDYTFSGGSVATQFRNQLGNWTPPNDLELGTGYTIKFYLTHTHWTNYYNPFYITRTIETESFTIGSASLITYPDLSQTVEDLSPTFQWEEKNNAQYKLVLGPADNPPNFSWDSNTGTYTVTNALFQSNVIEDTSLTLPESILQTNTEYVISIITSFDGVEFRSSQSFTTRESGAILSDLKFYNQVTPNTENQSNYIVTGLPIRFKTSVKNELTQNLLTLTGEISCTTTGVTITDNSANYNNIPSGSIGWGIDEFEIIVDESVPAGTLLEFELTTDDQIVTGGPWVSSFSFPIAPIENGLIFLDDDSNPDSNGDNDGIPEPGETIEILPLLDNVSDFTMALVNGKLTCQQNFINIWNGVNGASGFVYDTWDYNLISNVHAPIDPGATNVMPEADYVFDYQAGNPLQQLDFDMILSGNLNDASGPLMKWTSHFIYNEGLEPPPTIASTIPIDNAIDVDVDANLIMVFDKTVFAVANKFIYIYKSDGTIYSTIEATDTQISVSNELVTINPAANLIGGIGYYIIIDEGAFVDGSSNEFEGIGTPDIWNFTTIQNDPPAAPQNVSAVTVSSSEIEISWDAVSNADTYQVLSCDESITYVNSTTLTNYLVQGLEPSTYYGFIVKGVNNAGPSAASICVNVTTFCEHPWGVPVTYNHNPTFAYGIVTIDGQPATEDDLVGIFVGDELRGIGTIHLNNGVSYMPSTAIEGEVIETASFLIWDQSECAEVPVMYTTNTNPGGTIGFPPNYLPIDGMSVVGIESSFKVFLEGPFNGTEMFPFLNFFGQVPLNQPYNIEPWNYTGTESVTSIPNSNIVDWVLVELRDAANATSATSGTLLAKQAGFILKDGSIVGLDGASNLQFNIAIANNLFAIIHHRNHLSIMSANPLTESDGVYSYDFTNDASKAFGGVNAQTEIATGIWGMMAADADANGQVDNVDKNDHWLLQNGNSGYLESDFDLNGSVNNIDKGKWEPNAGKGAQVPE